jgi:hypothetical protein
MKRMGRVGRATTRALPLAILVCVGVGLFGAFDVLRRGTKPAVAAIVALFLAAVVFSTYFVLGIAGYRLSADGTVRVRWPHALAVILAVVLGAGFVAYIALRSLPESWR